MQKFYEDVGPEPMYIRGGYFVTKSTNQDQKEIDFYVVDPMNKIVFRRV